MRYILFNVYNSFSERRYFWCDKVWHNFQIEFSIQDLLAWYSFILIAGGFTFSHETADLFADIAVSIAQVNLFLYLFAEGKKIKNKQLGSDIHFQN